MREARLWGPCGLDSEIAPLRSVMLAWPPDSIAAVTDPDQHLMLGRVDLAAMRAETESLAATFEAAGVEVHLARPPADAPANIVFLRDLFFMTPQGAVLARMASAQRAGEERHAARALADANIPILRTVAGEATFEGADALWIDPATVVVGTGFRTNAAGAEVVRQVLAEQGVAVEVVDLGSGVQHLLGAMVLVDHGLAVVDPLGCPAPLRALLGSRDIKLLELPQEERQGRAMNVVALGPGRVLMPAGNPRAHRQLEAAGVEVDDVDIAQHVLAAGGLGCMTGILWRTW